MRVVPTVCHVMCLLSGDNPLCAYTHIIILLPLDDHALLICMLYNFCYVVTALCILYCDFALCRELMSEWK